jgi:ubiquinone/menaquinone biosynthesis C-methylase UbiE
MVIIQMQIRSNADLPCGSDIQQIAKHLPLQGTKLLELGCGRALTTRQLAENFPDAKIIATEVDKIQHEKNLQIDDLPNVTFKYGGAEAIESEDNSIDAVIMLKALHHVPTELLDQGLQEIRRVLKPGGLAYISEPVYAGEFNDIMRMFHDEKVVREAAFAALQKAVESELFELQDEIFFNSTTQFQDFEEFEKRIFGATHTEHNISPELYQQVKARFSLYIDADGQAKFITPIRVDLLRKPAV